MWRVSLLVAFAACGPNVEEVDLSGVYKVDEAIGSAPCEDVDLPVQAPAYVKFEASSIGDGYQYSGCSDAGGASCSSLGIIVTFDEPTDGGWRNRDTYVNNSTGNCFIGYFDMSATLDEATLVYERHIYEADMIAGGMCNSEEALKRNTTMPCVDHAKWTMTAQ